jgi:hypothetical protein
MRDAAWRKPFCLLLCLAAPSGLASELGASAAAAAPSAGCLASGNGFLRARIRGALNLDIDWKNAELECDGSARPNGHGIRLSFAGPLRSGGRRMRMVFGVATTAEGAAGRALPTNITVIFEGEQRLYTTRGDKRCTVDQLQEQRVGALGPGLRSYRVVARGFCTEPAVTLDQGERILVTRFDFAGRVSFENTTLAAHGEHPQ